MDIATVFTGLSGAQTVLRAAIAARDDLKIANATQELNGRIIDVQGLCLQLQQDKASAIEAERTQKDTVRDLQQRIIELERKTAERDQYELAEIFSGTFVYRSKAGNPGVPLHSLCQPCMDNAGEKAVLQSVHGWTTKVFCPKCKTEYRSGAGGGGDARIIRG